MGVSAVFNTFAIRASNANPCIYSVKCTAAPDEHAAELPPCPAPTSSTPFATKKKGKRRGKSSSRPRGGKDLKAAGGDSYVADTMRLRRKLISMGDFYKTRAYSIERDGSHVTTGWQGRNPPPRARSQIRRLYGTSEMQRILELFFPVYANLCVYSLVPF